MISFSFYTTAGCHLCDDAESLLKVLGQHPQLANQFQYHPVEISDTDELIEAYGVRIPVLANRQGEELGWPFSIEELGQWLLDQIEP
ncbi:glutaredoxin family protein [Endozoicomonas sp. OPT23]|uniref:glutaredoxin family protein n=1 Tax=Endozoicomonas sp. OPT23 TaxID=2072845 RepID=UPI001DA22CB1|nr:glutaredoxin family protein [Endozoicomonas sp. OPT23]